MSYTYPQFGTTTFNSGDYQILTQQNKNDYVVSYADALESPVYSVNYHYTNYDDYLSSWYSSDEYNVDLYYNPVGTEVYAPVVYTYGRFFFLGAKKDLDMLWYSYDEYNVDGYYNPFASVRDMLWYSYDGYNVDGYYNRIVSVRDRLSLCSLSDNTRQFADKYNLLVKYVYRYSKIVPWDSMGIIDDQNPIRRLVDTHLINNQFGEFEYVADSIVQKYYGSWIDLGLVDTDSIELFRQDVFSLGIDSEFGIFGETDVIAVCPIFDHVYSGLTSREIIEIS